MKVVRVEICSHFWVLWKQSSRLLINVGILRLLLLALAFFYLLIIIYSVSSKEKYIYYIVGCWEFILISIQVKRTDRKFLYINMDYDRFVCAIENIVLSLPLFICMILHAYWGNTLFVLLTAFLIGFVQVNYKKSHNKTLNTCIQKKIPNEAYEWKAGVRRSLFWLIPIWLIGFVGSYFIIVGCISIFLIGLIVFDFYREGECWQMLISQQKSARKFLFFKIKQHLVLFILLILPIVGMLLVFNPERWYVPIVEVIALLGIHLYSIVLKYAYYSHHKVPLNSILRIMGLIIGLNPFTAPLLYVFSVYLFAKASTNLNLYLHDYN